MFSLVHFIIIVILIKINAIPYNYECFLLPILIILPMSILVLLFCDLLFFIFIFFRCAILFILVKVAFWLQRRVNLVRHGVSWAIVPAIVLNLIFGIFDALYSRLDTLNRFGDWLNFALYFSFVYRFFFDGSLCFGNVAYRFICFLQI